jgi:hypothetical protein
MDRRAEQVHAHQGQVAGWILRLLHEAAQPTAAIQLRYAEAGGVSDRLQEYESVRIPAQELLHEVPDATADEVVAQVHDERLAGQKGACHLDRVGKAEGRLLQDVGEVQREARRLQRGAHLVARLGGQDHAHLADFRFFQVAHHVMQDGDVGHGDELLGHGVGEGPEPRALSAREDQGLHVIPPWPSVL